LAGFQVTINGRFWVTAEVFAESVCQSRHSAKPHSDLKILVFDV